MNFDARSALFSIVDPTMVGQARRAAAFFAERAALDESAAGKLAILVTELANNLHKHAREGSIVIRQFRERQSGVEVLAIDKGPGMADVEKCFRDGYSTIGTPGTGLGSVARLASSWNVYSIQGTGTILSARVLNPSSPVLATRLEFGSVCLPLKGESHCGDNWAHAISSAHERVMVVDGLGHGVHAAEAADEAAAAFREHNSRSLPDLMQTIHNALRKTRGAAVALAELDASLRVIRYVGVGNISATILHAGTTRSLVSQNGTVGHESRRIQEFQYPWPQDSTLVMNSDGLLTKWDLSKFPGLAQRPPALLAGALWRDFTRGRDDVTVLAVKERSAA